MLKVGVNLKGEVGFVWTVEVGYCIDLKYCKLLKKDNFGRVYFAIRIGHVSRTILLDTVASSLSH